VGALNRFVGLVKIVLPADHYSMVEIQSVESNELPKEKRAISLEKRAQKPSGPGF
jgi:hypothetical protein